MNDEPEDEMTKVYQAAMDHEDEDEMTKVETSYTMAGLSRDIMVKQAELTLLAAMDPRGDRAAEMAHAENATQGRVFEETIEEGAGVLEHPSLKAAPDLRPEGSSPNHDIRHVMVDLETWGTGNMARIISIGAVLFDPLIPFDGQDYESFYCAIDPTLVDIGVIDAKTIMYWMGETMDEARKAWLKDEKSNLVEALYGFSEWMKWNKHRRLWSNGAVFDIVILRNTFEKVAMDVPWNFRDERCFRTIKNMANNVTWEVPRAKVKKGPDGVDIVPIRHNALADATWQANALLHIAHNLRFSLD
jgi:hypothetical protein